MQPLLVGDSGGYALHAGRTAFVRGGARRGASSACPTAGTGAGASPMPRYLQTRSGLRGVDVAHLVPALGAGAPATGAPTQGQALPIGHPVSRKCSSGFVLGEATSKKTSWLLLQK